MNWLPSVVVASFAAWWLVRRIRRGRQIVKQWAEANGYQVVRRLPSWWRMGPFPVAAFGKQSVHYLELRDRNGTIRRCWLKVGDFVVGQLDDRVDVAFEQGAA
jgi:hypothetical protein